MRTWANEKGFTLIELLIVLAIIGTLASTITLVAPKFMDKGKKQEAEMSVRSIATALIAFYDDMGHWPTYTEYTTGEQTTDSQCTVTALFTMDFDKDETVDLTITTPDISGDKTLWDQPLAKAELMDRHLQLNMPEYKPLSGRIGGWPYLEDLHRDPWGNSYLVNIGGFYDCYTPGEGDTHLIWVISAGPNGDIETKLSTTVEGTSAELPECAGDDICFLVGTAEFGSQETAPTL